MGQRACTRAYPFQVYRTSRNVIFVIAIVLDTWVPLVVRFFACDDLQCRRSLSLKRGFEWCAGTLVSRHACWLASTLIARPCDVSETGNGLLPFQSLSVYAWILQCYQRDRSLEGFHEVAVIGHRDGTSKHDRWRFVNFHR